MTDTISFTDLTLLNSEGSLSADRAWDCPRVHICNHACHFTGWGCRINLAMYIAVGFTWQMGRLANVCLVCTWLIEASIVLPSGVQQIIGIEEEEINFQHVVSFRNVKHLVYEVRGGNCTMLHHLFLGQCIQYSKLAHAATGNRYVNIVAPRDTC